MKRSRSSTRMWATVAAATVAVVGAGVAPLASPALAAGETFEVTGTAGTYTAASTTTTQKYSGTLKEAVEGAARNLNAAGGGTISFVAGDFDFGAQYFKVDNLRDITFTGAGMDQTTIRNSSDVEADTEPFNFSTTNNVTVRDMTVAAGGADRSTSDALDFDNGTNSQVVNVKITDSRGRGIVFDGKGTGWSSTGNLVSGCVITDLPYDGIEVLASSNNVIENCTITGVGRNALSSGHGIQLNKSSTTAKQPNKKSSSNIVRNNTIDQSGMDGINVNGGDDNQIVGNTITNSSDVKTSRDGIRIGSADNVSCNDTLVQGNTATDNQATKTQRYGLAISSALCNRTVVKLDNKFEGNRVVGKAPVPGVYDLGIDTIFGDPPPKPVANFTYAPQSVQASVKVQFTDTSTNNPTRWQWRFGDGGTSSVKNPVHTFQKQGSYDVTLVASNAGGSSTEVMQTLRVSGPPPLPVAEMVAPTTRFVTTTTVRSAWKSKSGSPQAAKYELFERSAGPRTSFDSRSKTLTTTSTSDSFRGRVGNTYCMSVRGLTASGTAGERSAERCTAVPLDDRNLTRKGTWKAVSRSSAYMNTVLETSRRGASLSKSVRTKSIALLVTRCPDCGTVRVYLGKQLLAKKSLVARKRQVVRLVPVATFSRVREGTLRIVVSSSGRPVIIDGLGVSRR